MVYIRPLPFLTKALLKTKNWRGTENIFILNKLYPTTFKTVQCLSALQ